MLTLVYVQIFSSLFQYSRGMSTAETGKQEERESNGKPRGAKDNGSRLGSASLVSLFENIIANDFLISLWRSPYTILDTSICGNGCFHCVDGLFV